MGHVPHLHCEGPWEVEELIVTRSQRDHLERVMRHRAGEPVSYSDGRGRLGMGVYDSGVVVRGEEHTVDRPSELIVAAAPPAQRDRARYLVEKLAELGVARLQWMRTEYGSDDPPSHKKVLAWALSAFEQSRGVWLMETNEGLVDWPDLDPPVVAADPSGDELVGQRPRTVVIGPEGGWAPDEIPETVERLDLGTTILRVETAALVAAARLL